MYPVSNAFLDAVKANTRKYYWTGRITIAIATVDNIHTLLHPTFQMAVRDDIIWKNPTDGVMTEITKKSGIHRGVRHALTAEQQKAFMDYIANHPVYAHWWPLFTIFLGTGCRIGEGLGLRWEDIDFEKSLISINPNFLKKYRLVGR